MDLANLVANADLDNFPLIGEGNSAVIRRIPETNLVIKIFQGWPSTEIGHQGGQPGSRDSEGLSLLHQRLRQAQAPLPESTSIVSLRETASYKEGDYPYGIVMDYLPNMEHLGYSKLQPSRTSPLADEYVALIGRLHAQGIIISPRELQSGRHKGSQALEHIPRMVEGRLILLDWTNLALIEQILSSESWQQTLADVSCNLLQSDLLGNDGYSPLFGLGQEYNKNERRRRAKIYLASFEETADNKQFCTIYQQSLSDYPQYFEPFCEALKP